MKFQNFVGKKIMYVGYPYINYMYCSSCIALEIASFSGLLKGLYP
jgi:hypothetical protein